MFQIRLTNFRCFADAYPVEVRPITFLVGENSTGKTSFLAASRLLFGGLGRQQLTPFNQEPFRLGGFEEIAYNTGKKNQRASSFSLEIKILPDSAHRLTFGEGESQPELIEYQFTTEDLSAVIKLVSKTTITLYENGQPIFEETPDGVPPVGLIRRDISYIRFIFQSLRIRREEPTSEQAKNVINSLSRIEHQFFNSLSKISKDVLASAPVRTQPSRVYIPSEITPTSEGQHILLDLARQRGNKKRWAKVQGELADFGRNAGLFKNIDVLYLGSKRPNDPFQILVNASGPKTNIVDVGYGVSQSLPIIYQLEQAKGRETFLLQQPEVHLHPRAQAELGSLIARVAKQNPGTMYLVETHSDYIIDRVRMEVSAGVIPYDCVTIVFFDKTERGVKPTNIYLSHEGDVVHAPESYRAFFLEEQQRLLGF